MLKHRLLFGALLIAALVGLIFADDWLSGLVAADGLPEMLTRLGLHTCDGPLITVVLLVLVVIGTRELHRLFGAAGHAPLGAWPVLINVGLVLIAFHAGNGPTEDGISRRAADHRHTVEWLTIALLGAALLTARRRKTDHAVSDIATTLLMVLYLGLLPQYIIRLRLGAPGGAAWLLLYFLGTVKVCDIGAYFTGRALGRHKLIPWLSPGKTIEGLAGGVACSVLVAMLVPLLAGAWAEPSSPVGQLFPGPVKTCVFGLLMGLAGQGGDLLESLLKRDARVKDSAKGIPAFGGVLDILDSPLVAAPFACWMLLEW
jgi:phosphatidate cytidylyltransferase